MLLYPRNANNAFLPNNSTACSHIPEKNNVPIHNTSDLSLKQRNLEKSRILLEVIRKYIVGGYGLDLSY